MKKLLNYVLILLVMIFPFTFVSAKTTTTTTEAVTKNGTPVNLYVFYGSTCSHCADLHSFLAELEEDEEYNYMFEVVDYEVWSDDDNATLMSDVAEKLGTEASGVPFYVVGDYYSEGFPDISSTDEDVKAVVESTEQDLKDAIEKAYKAANSSNPTYEDIVAEVGSGNATVSDDEKDETDSKANDVIGYIILGITVIIIIAIIFGRSSSKDETLVAEEVVEEEAEEEEVEEEVEEEPKKVAKKVAKKSTSTAKKVPAKKTTTTKKATSTKSTTKKTTTTKKTSTSKKTK